MFETNQSKTIPRIANILLNKSELLTLRYGFLHLNHYITIIFLKPALPNEFKSQKFSCWVYPNFFEQM